MQNYRRVHTQTIPHWHVHMQNYRRVHTQTIPHWHVHMQNYRRIHTQASPRHYMQITPYRRMQSTQPTMTTPPLSKSLYQCVKPLNVLPPACRDAPDAKSPIIVQDHAKQRIGKSTSWYARHTARWPPHHLPTALLEAMRQSPQQSTPPLINASLHIVHNEHICPANIANQVYTAQSHACIVM